MAENTITFEVFPINNRSHLENRVFPEQRNELLQVSEDTVGVSFSGGGSRSHTLTVGYLRALRDLGLDKDVSYISAVSGGSWASSVYTFSDQDTDTLLGPATDPTTLSYKNLNKLNPGTLGQVITNFNVVFSALRFYFSRLSKNKIWQRLIGEHILKPFGLQNKTIAVDKEHVDSILQRNPNSILTKEDFATPVEGRPFLIINATLNGPNGYNTGWGNSLQVTPLYAGVPFYNRNKQMPFLRLPGRAVFKVLKKDALYLTRLRDEQFQSLNRPKTDIQLTVGGGAVETFAFGTTNGNTSLLFQTLELLSEEHYFGSSEAAAVLKTKEPFLLEDAVGASSAAYAAAFENRSLFDRLMPEINYFPVLNKNDEDTRFGKLDKRWVVRKSIGDGGNYENTGLLALLQRGIRKLVCCVNSAVPIDRNFVDNKFSNEDDVKKGISEETEYVADSQFLALFGAVELINFDFNYTENQVFRKEDLNRVLHSLLRSIENGNGAFAKHTLEVVENQFWNIQGGHTVDIVFVYNEECKKFESLLPKDMKTKISRCRGRYSSFPFYKTAFENIRPFALSKRQVNLLAAQGEYVFHENKDILEDLFQNSRD